MRNKISPNSVYYPYTLRIFSLCLLWDIFVPILNMNIPWRTYGQKRNSDEKRNPEVRINTKRSSWTLFLLCCPIIHALALILLCCRGPLMSIVVLYCWCHSDSASVLLFFTLVLGQIVKRKQYVTQLSQPQWFGTGNENKYSLRPSWSFIYSYHFYRRVPMPSNIC